MTPPVPPTVDDIGSVAVAGCADPSVTFLRPFRVLGITRTRQRPLIRSSSNDPTNQEVISKPRDHGGHDTGRFIGQRELPDRLLDGVGCMVDSDMQGGPVDELLDVAVERPALDQLEVEVGRTLEDRVHPGLTGTPSAAPRRTRRGGDRETRGLAYPSSRPSCRRRMSRSRRGC